MENTANNHNAAEHGGDSAWAQALRNVAIFAESGRWTQERAERYKKRTEDLIAPYESKIKLFLTVINNKLQSRKHTSGSDSEKSKAHLDRLMRDYAEYKHVLDVAKHTVEMLSAPWARYSHIPREE